MNKYINRKFIWYLGWGLEKGIEVEKGDGEEQKERGERRKRGHSSQATPTALGGSAEPSARLTLGQGH